MADARHFALMKMTTYDERDRVFFIYLFITCNWVDTRWHGVVTCYISMDYEDFTLKFRYGGLHVKHVVATWNCQGPSQHLLKDLGKPRKT